MELQPERPVLKMIELQQQPQEGISQPEDPAALTVDVPTFTPVQCYTWQDRGDFIQLQIATTHHVAGAQSSANQLLLYRRFRTCPKTWSSYERCLNGVDNAGICVMSDVPASSFSSMQFLHISLHKTLLLAWECPDNFGEVCREHAHWLWAPQI